MSTIKVSNVQANSPTSERLVEIKGVDMDDPRLAPMLEAANKVANDRMILLGRLYPELQKPYSVGPENLVTLQKNSRNSVVLCSNGEAQLKFIEAWLDSAGQSDKKRRQWVRSFGDGSGLKSLKFCNDLRDAAAVQLGGEVVEDKGPSLPRRLGDAVKAYQEEKVRQNEPPDTTPNPYFSPRAGRYFQSPPSLLARLVRATTPDEFVPTVEKAGAKPAAPRPGGR